MKKSKKEYRNHPTQTRVQNHRYKKRHIWAWVTGIVALVAVVAIAAYFASVYFKAKNAVDKTYDPHTAVKTTGEFNGKKRFAVLLMGTDTGALNRTEKRGRTDTMILAVVNPAKKHYTLVSIQRQVIVTLIKKAVSISSLSNLDSILTSVSSNVRTNLPFSALQQIAMNYRNCANSSSSDYLHGYNAEIKDAAYQIQPTSELQRISYLVRSELGLEKEVVQNNETFQNEQNEANGFSFESGKTQHYNIYDYTGEGDN